MIDVIFIWSQIFFLTLVVFSISSGWLYTDGVKEIRDWYFHKTFDSKLWFIKKLSHLAICQLCCGFWFAMSLQWLILDWYGVAAYLFVSLVVGGLVWIMGGLTRFFLWGAAFFQNQVQD